MDWEYIIKVYLIEISYGVLMFYLGYRTYRAIRKERRKK
jgi:hypothetical protein